MVRVSGAAGARCLPFSHGESSVVKHQLLRPSQPPWSSLTLSSHTGYSYGRSSHEADPSKGHVSKVWIARRSLREAQVLLAMPLRWCRSSGSAVPRRSIIPYRPHNRAARLGDKPGLCDIEIGCRQRHRDSSTTVALTSKTVVSAEQLYLLLSRRCQRGVASAHINSNTACYSPYARGESQKGYRCTGRVPSILVRASRIRPQYVAGASSLEHRKNKLRVRGNAKSFSYVCSMAYPEIHAWAMPDAYHFHFSSRNQLDLSTYKEQPVSPLHSVMYRLDTPSLDDHSHLSRTWSLSLGTSCRRK